MSSVMRELRLAAEMTQARLAHLVGVGVPHISKIERGLEDPSPALAEAISRTIGPCWRFCAGCDAYDFTKPPAGWVPPVPVEAVER